VRVQGERASRSRSPVVDRLPLLVVAAHAVTGVLTAWLVVAIGGSLGTAPVAIAAMWGSLLAFGAVAAAILVLSRARAWLWPDAVTALVSFYGATWAFSNSHSVAGDLAVIVVASLPVAIGAAAGYAIGADHVGTR